MKACGSLVLVELLAFEADPVALALGVSAERGGHHGHAAARADRRAVIVFHAVSIPSSRDSEATKTKTYSSDFSGTGERLYGASNASNRVNAPNTGRSQPPKGFRPPLRVRLRLVE